MLNSLDSVKTDQQPVSHITYWIIYLNLERALEGKMANLFLTRFIDAGMARRAANGLAVVISGKIRKTILLFVGSI